MHSKFFALAMLAMLGRIAAECANACNGHGRCTHYDMCLCNRNWQANDCSERVCQYGLAHVDTPKGDLDNSGTVSNADYVVVENNFKYPYGTTEAYPQMMDSDLNVITESAHYYMECSNKGTCDRKKGTCKCFSGYDGAACQRASCPGYPNSCSGHGTCKTIQQLATADHSNIYELWDKDATMGCDCDAGFYGADCSLRKCKTGVDPLYLDDSATLKYPTWNVATLAHVTQAQLGGDSGVADLDNVFYNGMEDGPGYWALRIYDQFGEDWLTDPIEGGASCAAVVEALEAIPNDVIPKGTVYCTLATADEATDPASVNENGPGYEYLSNGNVRPITYSFAFWEAIEDKVANDAPVAQASGDGAGGLPSSYTNLDQKLYGFVYQLKMFGNPGALKEPQVEIYLDGDRPTLAAVDFTHTPDLSDYEAKVITAVWTDGMQGENKDYFADHCDGVTVTVQKLAKSLAEAVALPERDIHYLSGMTAAEKVLLKTCLGSADFDDDNNVDSYDWDYGNRFYPHLIKLVRSVTVPTDGGHYVALIWQPYTPPDEAHASAMTGYDDDDDEGFFELVNPWHPKDDADGTTTNDYEVYTTKGTLALTSDFSDAYFGYASDTMYLLNAKNHSSRMLNGVHDIKASRFGGGISCEMTDSIKYRSTTHPSWDQINFEKEFVDYCVSKGDIIIPLAISQDYLGVGTVNSMNKKSSVNLPGTGVAASSAAAADVYWNYNPRSLNLYTAEKLYTRDYIATEADAEATPDTTVLGLLSNSWRNVIKTDLSSNWATTQDGGAGFQVYKFFPAAASTYEYVAPCSNRGVCDEKTGLCQCFPGYGDDNCDTQDSLSL